MQPHGIFLAPPFNVGPESVLPDRYYQSQNMDGVSIRARWNSINDSPGTYDFSGIAPDVDRAVSHGKQIVIGIIAGPFAPEWLKALCGPLTFDIMSPNLKRFVYPTPWHPLLAINYLHIHAALADWLYRRGAWDSVVGIRVGPLSQDTFELSLPRREDLAINAYDVWVHAGYRPSLVVHAYQRMVSGVANAFDDKALVQPISDGEIFPRIAEDGSTKLKYSQVHVQRDIIDLATATYGGRWIGLDTGLGATLYDSPMSPILASIGKKGGGKAWQTNASGKQYTGITQTACYVVREEPQAPCDAAEYRDMLRRGKDEGGLYVEVWPSDFDLFEAEIAALRGAP